MDNDLEEFRRLVQSQTNEKGDIPSFVGEWAESFINEHNAEELIEFLIRLDGGVFEAFCERIDSAPKTESEWESSYVVGPGIPSSEEKQAEYRAKWKYIVAIVRNTKAFHEYEAKNA